MPHWKAQAGWPWLARCEPTESLAENIKYSGEQSVCTANVNYWAIQVFWKALWVRAMARFEHRTKQFKHGWIVLWQFYASNLWSGYSCCFHCWYNTNGWYVNCWKTIQGQSGESSSHTVNRACTTRNCSARSLTNCDDCSTLNSAVLSDVNRQQCSIHQSIYLYARLERLTRRAAA